MDLCDCAILIEAHIVPQPPENKSPRSTPCRRTKSLENQMLSENSKGSYDTNAVGHISIITDVV